MTPVYEVAKWKTVFETAEARRLKSLNWVSVPVDFSSFGYQQMLDEFGDDAPAIYGAWIALVAFSASCPVRGVLASSRGQALPISHLARVTGFPAQIFERLIAWASSEEVGWLLVVADPVRVAENTAKQGDSETPSESPATPSDRPANPLQRPANPLPTEQDITRPDITKPAAAASAAAGARMAAAAAADGVGLGPGSSPTAQDPAPEPPPPKPSPPTVQAPAPQPAVPPGVDPFFAGLDLAAVRSVAGRLRTAAPTLPRDVVWRSAAIGQVIDPELIPGVIARLAKREIGKPESYLEKTLRDECERLGHDYRRVKRSAPPTPPPEPHRSEPARTDQAKAEPIPKPAFRRPPRPERNVRVLEPVPSSNHQPRRTAAP